MNLRARVEKLEVAMVPVREAHDLVRIMVPAKDGRPFGTEGGLQRIRYGDFFWHRQAGEAEADFLERAKADAPLHPHRRGLRVFVADYATPDDA